MYFFIALVIFIAGVIVYKFRHDSDIAVRTIVATLIIIASCCYLTYTESGKRIVKDFTSNVSGGIPRHVSL